LYSNEDILDSESFIFDTESELSWPIVVGHEMVFGENRAEGWEITDGETG